MNDDCGMLRCVLVRTHVVFGAAPRRLVYSGRVKEWNQVRFILIQMRITFYAINYIKQFTRKLISALILMFQKIAFLISFEVACT